MLDDNNMFDSEMNQEEFSRNEEQQSRPANDPQGQQSYYQQGQPSYSGQQNYYQQSNGAPYGNGPHNYQPYQQDADKNGFGIASLVLGIIALVLFCTCINIFLGILAIIFGIIQIVKYEKKGMAIAGIVTAAVSIVLFFVSWALMFSSADFNDMMTNDFYKEFMEEYNEEFPGTFGDDIDVEYHMEDHDHHSF